MFLSVKTIVTKRYIERNIILESRVRVVFTLVILSLLSIPVFAQFVPEVDSLLKARTAAGADTKEDRKSFSYFNVAIDRKYGGVKTQEQVLLVLNDPNVSLGNKMLFSDFLPNTLFNTKADLDSLIDYYAQLLEKLYDEADNQCRASKFLTIQAGLYGYNKRYDEVRAVFDRMAQEQKKNKCVLENFVYQLEISNNLYEPLGNTSKAIESHLKALHILDSLKQAKFSYPFFYELDVYNEFAGIYYHMGNWRQAIQYWKKDISLIEKNGTWGNYLVGCYNNIGISYRKMLQYDTALYYLNKCVERAVATNDEAWIGIGNGNIGDIYADQGKYQEAISYLEEDVRRGYVYYQYGSITTALSRMGICYQGLGQLGKAKVYYDSALGTFKRWPNPVAYNTYTYNMLLTIYQHYASLEYQLGNFKNAFLLNQKGEVFSDSLKQLLKRQEIASIQTYHAFEKQDTENKLLKVEIREQKLRESRTIILIVLIVAVVTSIIISYRLRIQKLGAEKKAAALIHEQAEEALLIKERELSSITMQIQQKNEVMNNLKNQLGSMAQKKSGLQDEVKSIYKAIRKDLNLQSDWEKFKVHFEKVHPEFFSRLSQAHYDLSLSDLRICAYLRINMENNTMSQILNISPDSLRVRKHRLRKRIGIASDKELYNYLASI
jgi:tetratricopeptide (TPR) repeat protein/DNA-binding CsgD family transcriptional regulator